MAGAKIIKKRIASVKNTRKITRTMEMVATAKSKKLVDRVNEAKPYGEKLREIMASLATQGGNIDSPYLRSEEKPKKQALLVVTANRGLCGGYNTNVLRMSRAHYNKLREAGVEVDVFVVGKKGNSFLKFIRIPIKQAYLNIDDTFKYEQAEELAARLMDSFEEREYDRVEVVSTVYLSAGSQKPDVTQLLPIGIGEATREPHPGSAKRTGESAAKKVTGPVIYEPEPAVIAAQMLPLAIKTTLYRIFLEAVASEQIARRVAMKNATDAAGDMVTALTRTYNRVRQASITQELAEIVGGADAL